MGILVAGALAALAVLVVIILVFIGLVVAGHHASSVAQKAERSLDVQAGRPPGYTGPSYPGMLTLDHVADARGQVEDYGFTVTATSFRRIAGQVCAAATYLNRDSTNGNYDYFLDWHLQQPTGVVLVPNPNGFISSGQLAPGASKSGPVCFDTTQHGRFVLTWHPLSFGRPDRGVWLFES